LEEKRRRLFESFFRREREKGGESGLASRCAKRGKEGGSNLDVVFSPHQGKEGATRRSHSQRSMKEGGKGKKGGGEEHTLFKWGRRVKSQSSLFLLPYRERGWFFKHQSYFSMHQTLRKEKNRRTNPFFVWKKRKGGWYNFRRFKKKGEPNQGKKGRAPNHARFNRRTGEKGKGKRKRDKLPL